MGKKCILMLVMLMFMFQTAEAGIRDRNVEKNARIDLGKINTEIDPNAHQLAGDGHNQFLHLPTITNGNQITPGAGFNGAIWYDATDNKLEAVIGGIKAEIATILRMTLSYFQDGKATVEIIAANEHPRMRLKSGFAQLIEAADSAATTFTVRVYNATAAVYMTDILTFTQGTEGVADIKAFTPDGTNHTAAKADVIQLVTDGTTTTAGEVVVHLEWLSVE